MWLLSDFIHLDLGKDQTSQLLMPDDSIRKRIPDLSSTLPKNNFSSQHLKSFWRIFEASNFQSASIKQCKISWRWLMIIGATLCMCGILMDSHNPIDCESSTKTCWHTTEAQTQSKKPGLGMPRAPWKSMECGGFQSPFRTSLDDRGHKNADRLDDLDDLRFYLDD